MAIDPIKVVIEGENRVLANFKTIEAASKKVFKQIRANATKELAGIGTGLSDSVVKGTGVGEKAAIASAKKIKQSFSSVFDGIQKSLKASLTVSSDQIRSEEHTSELQSPVPISYAVFCLKKKKH